MSIRRRLVGVLLVAVVAASCGAERPVATHSGGSNSESTSDEIGLQPDQPGLGGIEAAKRFANCDGDRFMMSVFDLITRADTWSQVVGIDPVKNIDELSVTPGYPDLRVDLLGEGGVSRSEVITMYYGMVAPLGAAVADSTVDVFVQTDADPVELGLPAEYVTLGVAVSERDFTFLGECDAAIMNDELIAALPGAELEFLKTVVSLSGGEIDQAVDRFLQTATLEPIDPDQVQYVPGLEEPKNVDDFVASQIFVDWESPSDAGEFAICVRSDLAWGECYGLDANSGAVASLSLYVSRLPETEAEVWLVDATDGVLDPVRLAARVDMELDSIYRPYVSLIGLDRVGDSFSVQTAVVVQCVPEAESQEGGLTAADCRSHG